MKKSYHNALLIVLLVFVFSSCQNNDKAKYENSKNIEVGIELDSLNNAIYQTPSPTEILGEILNQDINIKKELVNPYKNASNYITIRNQAVNMGVYIADFAYLNLSSDKTLELEYLKVVQDLSEKINIYGIFEQKTLNRINNNLQFKDSLNLISQEIYYNISNNLEKSDRQNIFVLISSGAIIESLYLSVNLVENFEDYKDIIQKMYEQKYVFDNFYEYAYNFSEDPYIEQILDNLDVLKDTFDKLEVEESEQQVIKKDDNSLVFKGGYNFILSKEGFEVFKKNITTIRNEVTTIKKG